MPDFLIFQSSPFAALVCLFISHLSSVMILGCTTYPVVFLLSWFSIGAPLRRAGSVKRLDYWAHVDRQTSFGCALWLSFHDYPLLLDTNWPLTTLSSQSYSWHVQKALQLTKHFTHLRHANLVRWYIFWNTAFPHLILYHKYFPIFSFENLIFKGFHCIET